MRVFLTGATGNVGQPVLRELLKRNIEVTALVREPAKLSGCRTVVGQLADLAPVSDEISRTDAVIHLASPRDNALEPILRNDIRGMATLLESWRNGNFVYMSSQTVYGIPRQTLVESTPLSPVCWYDWGKICNEFQLRMAEKIGKRREAISLRMALLFGVGPRSGDRQFLSLVYEQCQKGRTFVFDSEEGLETYGSSFIGEEDLGRFVVDALFLKLSGPFNVSGGYCTWRSLIETINKYAGTRSAFLIRPDAKPGPGEFRMPQSRSYLDTRAFVSGTGAESRQSIDDLVRNFVVSQR
ncbi:MAG: NAD-dependent epimerase/dehydratase family protein [Sulfobacillus sp.]